MSARIFLLRGVSQSTMCVVQRRSVLRRSISLSFRRASSVTFNKSVESRQNCWTSTMDENEGEAGLVAEEVVEEIDAVRERKYM